VGRDRLADLTISLDGRMLDAEMVRLPMQVPARVAETLPAGAILASWAAYRGQLIAVFRSEKERFGVNRLGERFAVRDDGSISAADPDSRLWVAVGISAITEAAARAQTKTMLCIGLPLVWGAIAFVGWFVTRRALLPVKIIVDTVERIEISQLKDRLPLGTAEDELSSIARTVNRMLDRIEQGYQRERQFTGDAAHELRGPLATMIADAEVALSETRDVEVYRSALARSLQYARNMHRVVEALLLLARLDARSVELQKEPVDIGDLVMETVRLLSQDKLTRMRVNLGESRSPLIVSGDPRLIRVLLQNLIENALRYSPTEEPVTVDTFQRNGQVVVQVRDRGEGIREDDRERIFSRFFRLDASRSKQTGGAGLGLAIAQAIAEAHETRVVVEDAPGGGTIAGFVLRKSS